jgi:hypothetical protein
MSDDLSHATSQGENLPSSEKEDSRKLTTPLTPPDALVKAAFGVRPGFLKSKPHIQEKEGSLFATWKSHRNTVQVPLPPGWQKAGSDEKASTKPETARLFAAILRSRAGEATRDLSSFTVATAAVALLISVTSLFVKHDEISLPISLIVAGGAVAILVVAARGISRGKSADWLGEIAKEWDLEAGPSIAPVHEPVEEA